MDLAPITLAEMKRVLASLPDDYSECTVGFAFQNPQPEDGALNIMMIPIVMAVVHPDKTHVLLCDNNTGQLFFDKVKKENIKQV
jgi:hypothetical protein